LKIRYYNSLESTQLYLKEKIKNNLLQPPIAIVADLQTAGVGSRDNSWSSKKGDLFLSFAINIEDLVKDLKLESASIYFSFIMMHSLRELGSDVWLKWPNDLYIDNNKIGGMITNVYNNTLICGIGINMLKSNDLYGCLDIEISREKLLKRYFENVEKKILWKQIFSKYKLQFEFNRKFFTHINNKKVSLREAVLEDDGSITINSERIYSLR
jgi:BirA family biotin operon repressor/biotin-[acetyl-CoA-carboxylase] ligase